MKNVWLFLLVSNLISDLRVAAAPELPEAVVSGRSAHQATWSRVTEEVLQNGRVRARSSSYTEFSVGLNFLQNGQWTESREIIELFQGGAVFRQAQHKVIFDPNAAAPQGAIDLEMPDGKRWRSTVLGIAVFDPATQRSELIAEIKDSAGELQPPNVVLYPDAFDFVSGGRGSIRFICTRDKFEQDVICLNQIALPAGFGPESRLEVWSEVFGPPQFVKTTRQVGEANDDHLDFGSMVISSGRALTLEDPQGRTWSAPVFKTWTQTPDGRHFIVESLKFSAVQAQLNALPAPQGAGLNRPGPARQMAINAAGQRSFPPRNEPAKIVGPIKTAAVIAPPSPIKGERAGVRGDLQAANIRPQRGLVIDYATVTTTSNVVFKAGETYFLSGNCTIGGTNNVIEGGAVIKSTNGVTLTFTGPLESRTSDYLPTVFTSFSDNTAGQIINGSTGNPWTNYAATAAIQIEYAGSELQHLRISHASSAVKYKYTGAGVTHTLSHAQVVHCQRGAELENLTLRARNVLMIDVLTNLASVPSSYDSTAHGEHLTFCRADRYADVGSSSTLTLNFTNSLIVGVTNHTIAYENCAYGLCHIFNASNSDPAAVFQTVGASTAYLLNNTYRNRGTNNIDPTLLSEIKQRTTFPPIILRNTVMLDTVLSPQAQRDTDLPDLGYHPACIDFAVNTLPVTNATLTLTGGVVIATFGDYGIWLQDGSRLVSEGSAVCRNVLCRYNCVQEQSSFWESTSASAGVTINPYHYGDSAPSASLRFTDFDMLAGGGNQIYASGGSWSMSSLVLRDCEFTGGYAQFWGSTNFFLAITNCLFNRTSASFMFDPQVAVHNCLFYGSSSSLDKYTTNTVWTFQNNVFDGTLLYDDTEQSVNSYNAYIGGTTPLNPGNSVGDVVTNVLAYETGPLGYFYLPTTSPLIDKGSTNASLLGFAHFTTLTSQTPEMTNRLDIGYHRVALNGTTSTSTPLDDENDGYFNVVEDLNGNGVFDAGETDWKVYNSKYGIGSGPGLITFTPLK